MRADFLRMALAAIPLILLTACAPLLPQALQHTNPQTRQVIIVNAKGITANLSLWEKDPKDVWGRRYHFPAVIGRNGLADPGDKKEGDGKTPQGIYDIRRSFGYDTHFSTGIDYTPVTQEDRWVDDPLSADYNTWVKHTTASSFESLKRNDDLYHVAAVIEYNTMDIKKGAGSAIFLHIWRTYYKPTAGCVALSSRSLRKILSRLNKDDQPVIIIGNAHGY